VKLHREILLVTRRTRFIETAMTADFPRLKADALKMIRWAESVPDDVALLSCFLASDDASYITGHVLNVNGGMLMGV